MVQIFDGKKEARLILDKVKKGLIQHKKIRLDILLIGDNPASETYIKYKIKAGEKLGVECVVHRFKQVTYSSIVETLLQLTNVSNGILIQLPIDFSSIIIDTRIKQDQLTSHLISLIPYSLDVDCLGDKNLGSVLNGQSLILPATVSAVVNHILKGVDLEGKKVCIVNSSSLIGKPLAVVLSGLKATVIVCDKYTTFLEKHTLESDILITATGVTDLIKSGMVKQGAMVIDCGISYTTEGKVVGDVEFYSVSEIASFITPVPGGVGPLTIACLFENLLTLSNQYGK
jgi:methylenetetrahydrofolate dehydrogenase (NADP+) / methenyltetrahydrofolate cyclohydrolase